MDTESTAATERNTGETNRVEAFSDGVFAIAITLLILEIKVPELGEQNATNRDLWNELLRLGPSYFAFLTSFATIGIMWINHHRLFNLIWRSDEALLVLNSLLLLGVTFVPFPTSVIARYLLEPAGTTAAAFYSVTFVVTAIFFNLLWRYAAHRNRLINPRSDPRAVEAVSRAYLLGPVIYFAAFVLAFISPIASLALNLLIAVYFAIPNVALLRFLRRRS